VTDKTASQRTERVVSRLNHPMYWLFVGLVCLIITPLSPFALFASLAAWAAGCALAAKERNWVALSIQAVLLLFFTVLLVQLIQVTLNYQAWEIRTVVGP